MTLASKLQEDLQQAIRGRDELRRDTLRMAIAAAYNTSKQQKRELTDEEMIGVLTREVKTRRESVEAFASGGRPEAAAKELAEIEILAVYLPEQLDGAEVTRLVQETIGEVGASSPREMGKVMAALMPKLRGRADGKVVSATVARELATLDLTGHGH